MVDEDRKWQKVSLEEWHQGELVMAFVADINGRIATSEFDKAKQVYWKMCDMLAKAKGEHEGGNDD